MREEIVYIIAMNTLHVYKMIETLADKRIPSSVSQSM